MYRFCQPLLTGRIFWEYQQTIQISTAFGQLTGQRVQLLFSQLVISSTFSVCATLLQSCSVLSCSDIRPFLWRSTSIEADGRRTADVWPSSEATKSNGGAHSPRIQRKVVALATDTGPATGKNDARLMRLLLASVREKVSTRVRLSD